MQDTALPIEALSGGGSGTEDVAAEAYQGHAAEMRTKGPITRRVAQVLVALVALGATGVMLSARYPRGGDQLWEQGQAAENQGQYADAARAYERLASEYPTHPHASEALYQLGCVNRVYMNDPDAALAVFRRLLGRPCDDRDTKWKRWALRDTGDIYRANKNWDEAIRSFESLAFQYGEDAATRTEARLRLAQIYFEMKDAGQAKASCDMVLEMADAGRVASVRALRLKSEIADRLEDDPQAAMEPLTRIIQLYSGTGDADQANRDLAYLRSRVAVPTTGAESSTATEAAGDDAELPSSQAVWVELPRQIPGGVRDQGLLECLRVLCAAQGVVVSEEKLAGLSGHAFAFWYSSTDRQRGGRVYAQDPVETAAKRLGLSGARRLPAASETAALTLLKQQIHRKLAVMVPLTLGGRSTWRIVVGYDPGRSEFLLFSASGRYEAVDAADFRAGWSTGGGPAFRLHGAAPARYTMYVITGPTKHTGGAYGARAALRDAATAFRGASTGGYVSGAKAFRQLAGDFSKLAAGELDARGADDLAAWCGQPLSDLVARRELARKDLAIWSEARFIPADKAEQATALLGDSIDLLSRLAEAYRHARDGSGPSEGGGSPADLATKLAQIDEKLAEALSGLQ